MFDLMKKGLRFKFFQLVLILHTSQVNVVGFHEKGLRFKFFQLALILQFTHKSFD
jgi:hypothetical protein